MSISKQPRTVAVFGCGGMGINVTSSLAKLRKSSDEGFARVSTYYVDTSESNLIGKDVDEGDVFLFDGIDGSGYERAANFEAISKNSLAILQKFQPEDLNIVIHSAAGGSGSVIGPVLVSELKNRDAQVIVLVVGSTDTRIEIQNTIKTLQSYEAIAQKRGSPVVVHYLENSAEFSRAQVNEAVRSAVSLLCGLFSGQHEELDSADLKNWMNYPKFSGGLPQLASLNFARTANDIERAGTIVSVATLATPEMSLRLGQTPAYQCHGYVPENWRYGAPESLQMIKDQPIHYLISPDFISSATAALTATLKQVDERFASMVARPSILGKGAAIEDNGVVL